MPWQHTSDIPDGFEQELVALCRDALSDGEKRCDPVDLLRCWYSESRVSSRALNPHGYAAGIFQAMPATLHRHGWRAGDERWATPDGYASLAREFTLLSATEQLAYARAYYWDHRGSLTSPAACYVATFLPALIEHASQPSFVLCALPGRHPDLPQGRYVAAYEANHGAFDPEGKGWIAVEDLSARMDRVATGPRWDELRARVEAAQCGTPDVESISGIQCGLSRVGFDPGPVDGRIGPRTLAAVAAFRHDRGLGLGGIDQPFRDALLGALTTSA
jgi:hypothetical protein